MVKKYVYIYSMSSNDFIAKIATLPCFINFIINHKFGCYLVYTSVINFDLDFLNIKPSEDLELLTELNNYKCRNNCKHRKEIK